MVRTSVHPNARWMLLLQAKAHYYLKYFTEAERVRQAGRARALRDHTYHRRFEDLFHEINLQDR